MGLDLQEVLPEHSGKPRVYSLLSLWMQTQGSVLGPRGPISALQALLPHPPAPPAHLACSSAQATSWGSSWTPLSWPHCHSQCHSSHAKQPFDLPSYPAPSLDPHPPWLPIPQPCGPASFQLLPLPLSAAASGSPNALASVAPLHAMLLPCLALHGAPQGGGGLAAPRGAPSSQNSQCAE